MGQGDASAQGSDTVLAHIFTCSYRISDSNESNFFTTLRLIQLSLQKKITVYL